MPNCPPDCANVWRPQAPQLLRASGPQAAHFLAAHVAAVAELQAAVVPAGQRQAWAAAELGGLRPGSACPLALQPVASEVGSRDRCCRWMAPAARPHKGNAGCNCTRAASGLLAVSRWREAARTDDLGQGGAAVPRRPPRPYSRPPSPAPAPAPHVNPLPAELLPASHARGHGLAATLCPPAGGAGGAAAGGCRGLRGAAAAAGAQPHQPPTATASSRRRGCRQVCTCRHAMIKATRLSVCPEVSYLSGDVGTGFSVPASACAVRRNVLSCAHASLRQGRQGRRQGRQGGGRCQPRGGGVPLGAEGAAGQPHPPGRSGAGPGGPAAAAGGAACCVAADCTGGLVGGWSEAAW